MNLQICKHDRWTPWHIPRSIGAAWWSAEANNAANMTDAGAGVLTAWIDRYRALSLTAASTPTWSATGFNTTKSGIVFDGVDDCFSTTTLTNIPTGSTPGEIWGVGNTNGALSAQYFGAYGGTTTSSARTLRQGATGQLAVTDGSTASANVGGPLPALPCVAAGSWSGTTQNAFINGLPSSTNPATITTLNTGTTRLRVGSLNNTSASGFWAGPIQQILILSAVSSGITLPGMVTTLDKYLEGYFAWTGGFQTSLPITHRFYNRAP